MIYSEMTANFGKRLQRDRENKSLTRAQFGEILRNSPDKPKSILLEMERKTGRPLKLSDSWIARLEANQGKDISPDIKRWVARSLDLPEHHYLIENPEDHMERTVGDVIIEKIEDYGDCDLFCEPATFGIDTSFSPKMLELYFRFLANSNRTLFLVFRNNRYQTITYIFLITYILMNGKKAKKGELLNLDFDISDLRAVIRDILSPFNLGPPILYDMKKEKIHSNISSVIQFLDKRIVIYAAPLGRSVIKHNPFSFYRLIPHENQFQHHTQKTFFSLNAANFDELHSPHHDMIVRRFKQIPQPSSEFSQITFDDEITQKLVQYKSLENGIVLPNIQTTQDVHNVINQAQKIVAKHSPSLKKTSSNETFISEDILGDPRNLEWLMNKVRDSEKQKK